MNEQVFVAETGSKEQFFTCLIVLGSDEFEDYFILLRMLNMTLTNFYTFHKSIKQNANSKAEPTRTSEVRGENRCHGGVSFPCRPVAPAVCSLSKSVEEKKSP